MNLQSESEDSVDPDQLASQKPADPDLHCIQNRTRVQHDKGCRNRKAGN